MNTTFYEALIAAWATINIIIAYKLIEKDKTQLPDSIVGNSRCPNLKCISNSEEAIKVILESKSRLFKQLLRIQPTNKN